jgi:hypothetical protein
MSFLSAMVLLWCDFDGSEFLFPVGGSSLAVSGRRWLPPAQKAGAF